MQRIHHVGPQPGLSLASAEPGKPKRDAGAVLLHARLALDLDPPAMRGDDVADEGERQPFDVGRAATPLEEIWELLLRNAGTVVLHGDRDLSRPFVVLEL